MLKATEPGWSAADEDFADDVESCGVQCCACGEWVYVTSAEYDECEQEWICDECLDAIEAAIEAANEVTR